MSIIQKIMEEHRSAVDSLSALEADIVRASAACLAAIRNGGKILLCGNGGSAADAQHFSSEIVGRFLKERRGYPSIALTTDSSILTSVSNDYTFDTVFARQVEALAQKGDVLIGISTSGSSRNVEKAMTAARSLGATTIGFLGRDGGSIKGLCDIPLVVPSNITARVQECHIIIIHMICTLLDEDLV